MSEKDAALLRSRLHIRAARILLQNKKITHGLATFYDALDYGFRWYYLNNFKEIKTDILYNINLLYSFLASQNKFNSSFKFSNFQKIVDSLLEDENNTILMDNELFQLTNTLEKALTDLNVLPFDENMLPHENDET